MVKPQEIKLKRPVPWEGWIPTFSGKGFFPITPRAEDVVIEDIARGIAYKFRYGGQTEPLTVAEHSILVSKIIEILWPESNQMLAGLLHDSCEAYTHDIQAPIRKFVKVQIPDGSLITWGDMERQINQVVAKALGIRQDFYTKPEVRAADILALALEKNQIPALQRAGNWGTPAIPADLKELKVLFLPPALAYEAFLNRFNALIKKEMPEKISI